MKNCFVEAGQNCVIQEGSIVGYRYSESSSPFRVGNNCCVRCGTIIYGDTEAGNDFQTGHNVLIREKTKFGNHIVVGSNSVIDGHVTIGNFVKIESNCYIPTHVSIGSYVFIGPGVVLTNDKYPQKMRDAYEPKGPTIEDGVTLGGGVVVVPDVVIGEGSFIAAGCVVTKDIPPMSFVKGVPGGLHPLPVYLEELNIAKNWRKYLDE